MVREGNLFRNISENIVIKLPMTWDGIKACKYFRSKNMKVNLTLCFSANQALIAAKAGATYVSLFLGRLEDIGCDAIATLRDIRQIYDNYSEINTKILAASIRNSSHVYQSMISGADIATMPAKIIHQLIDHPLTSTGLEIFNNDWKNSSIHL
jgi:transaldolase